MYILHNYILSLKVPFDINICMYNYHIRTYNTRSHSVLHAIDYS